MKNKTTAALLAFFLGVFGAHKFYLGKTVTGIIYIVITIFSLGLITGIISFVEFIMLLVMSDEDFNTKYNQK